MCAGRGQRLRRCTDSRRRRRQTTRAPEQVGVAGSTFVLVYRPLILKPVRDGLILPTAVVRRCKPDRQAERTFQYALPAACAAPSTGAALSRRVCEARRVARVSAGCAGAFSSCLTWQYATWLDRMWSAVGSNVNDPGTCGVGRPRQEAVESPR